jgi:hypothetical protein
MPKMLKLRFLTPKPEPPPATPEPPEPTRPPIRLRAGCADCSDLSANNDYTTCNEQDTITMLMECDYCPHCDGCTEMQHCGRDESHSYFTDYVAPGGCSGRPGCDGNCDCHDDNPCDDCVTVDTIAVVVMLGTNDMEMPCLTFATASDAVAFLTARFGPEDSKGRWVITDVDGMQACADDFFTYCSDGDGDIWAFEIREVEHGKPIAAFDLD